MYSENNRPLPLMTIGDREYYILNLISGKYLVLMESCMGAGYYSLNPCAFPDSALKKYLSKHFEQELRSCGVDLTKVFNISILSLSQYERFVKDRLPEIQHDYLLMTPGEDPEFILCVKPDGSVEPVPIRSQHGIRLCMHIDKDYADSLIKASSCIEPDVPVIDADTESDNGIISFEVIDDDGKNTATGKVPDVPERTDEVRAPEKNDRPDFGIEVLDEKSASADILSGIPNAQKKEESFAKPAANTVKPVDNTSVSQDFSISVIFDDDEQKENKEELTLAEKPVVKVAADESRAADDISVSVIFDDEPLHETKESSAPITQDVKSADDKNKPAASAAETVKEPEDDISVSVVFDDELLPETKASADPAVPKVKAVSSDTAEKADNKDTDSTVSADTETFSKPEENASVSVVFDDEPLPETEVPSGSAVPEIQPEDDISSVKMVPEKNELSVPSVTETVKEPEEDIAADICIDVLPDAETDTPEVTEVDASASKAEEKKTPAEEIPAQTDSAEQAQTVEPEKKVPDVPADDGSSAQRTLKIYAYIDGEERRICDRAFLVNAVDYSSSTGLTIRSGSEYTVSVRVSDTSDKYREVFKGIMTEDREIRLNYYTVRINGDSGIGYTIGEGIYSEGSVCSISANVISGHEWKCWAGDSAVKENPLNFIVSRRMLFKAKSTVSVRAQFMVDNEAYIGGAFMLSLVNINGVDYPINDNGIVEARADSDVPVIVKIPDCAGGEADDIIYNDIPSMDVFLPVNYYSLMIRGDNGIRSISGNGLYRENSVVNLAVTVHGEYSLTRLNRLYGNVISGMRDGSGTIRVTQPTMYKAVTHKL